MKIESLFEKYVQRFDLFDVFTGFSVFIVQLLVKNSICILDNVQDLRNWGDKIKNKDIRDKVGKGFYGGHDAGSEVKMVWICEEEMCTCSIKEACEIGYGGYEEG